MDARDHYIDDDRATTFAALTASDSERYRPFRWQTRLLERFEAGDLPSVVDIPTGLGKTSVMALWLMALAGGAGVPRRLVYVVDRRAVVDQATRFAERLRENMTPSVACGLRLGDRRLPISTLRGGFADNREWLEDPSLPAIVVGTVDMVGSRLLFEGYGVSRGMRPYHAGLLATDSLVVLDEAHLCPPFEALLRDIAAHRDTTFGPIGRNAQEDRLPPPFRLMSLSATSRPAHDAFRLEGEDRAEVLVRQRLSARKRLRVSDVDVPKRLPEALAREAIDLGFGKQPVRVVVYCNSRKDALSVKALLDKQIKAKAKSAPGAGKAVSELLVGERRVYERTKLEDWLKEKGFVGGRAALDASAFLVATSAGEVGVDMDADHMVCDLVAHERMVQRLGRVNRRGGQERSAEISVVVSPPAKSATANQGLVNASRAALTSLPIGPDEHHDASPEALVNLRGTHQCLVERATTPAPLHPALTRPCLEAWAMTSLKQHEGRPEVAPWLRGWEKEEEPNTQVVWRTHLPVRREGDEVAAPKSLVESFFRVAPIHPTERIEAARSHVLDWLNGRVRALQSQLDDNALAMSDSEIVALVISPAGDLIATASVAELAFMAKQTNKLSKREAREQKRRKDEWSRGLAGTTVVLDSWVGGLTDGMLDPKSGGDVATADADEAWRQIKEESTSPHPVIKFRVVRLTGEEDAEGLATVPLDGWMHVRTFETSFNDAGSPDGGLAVFTWRNDAGDDDASRSILSAPQTLRDHAKQVATCVREIAERLGLATEEVEALERAARLHDDGKAAQRWQDAMNAPDDGRPYAKTRGGGHMRLLEGYRHEFGSLLKAERAALPRSTRELVLHLIAAHHGSARPLISVRGCDEGPPSQLESKAGDAAVRYAMLQRRYGVWGLAWRESILRAADQRASREWTERAKGGGPKNG